jgi:hypothetical protein
VYACRTYAAWNTNEPAPVRKEKLLGDSPSRRGELAALHGRAQQHFHGERAPTFSVDR